MIPFCILFLLTGSYQSENEVNPTDDLDFKHHNYKDMRQVGFKVKHIKLFKPIILPKKKINISANSR